MRILLLDTETSPHLTWTFQLRKAFIQPSMIVKPTRILCWAAKWLGQKRVHFCTEHSPNFITKIYDMINKADGIVHYNGKAFDMKHLNREFLLNDPPLPPPSSYTNIDLLQAFRANFAMASNKLEYTSVALGYEGKVQHRGIQLWFDCMDNKRSAWQEMKEYNIRDVTVLEEMYHDLLPWLQHHPNAGHWAVDGDCCKRCGGTNIKRDGWERTTTVPYQRFRCTDCGTPLKGFRRDKTKPKPEYR